MSARISTILLLVTGKPRIQERIRKDDQVTVICGEYTHTATAVSIELQIAQEERKPYFLLQFRASKT